MALFHAATITPTKAELVTAVLADRSWGSSEPVDELGAFRFDDPAGRVGLETHLARIGAQVFQVPLTYREAPIAAADVVGDDDPFIGEMEHSALGTRYVYDGLGDARFVTMLAAVAMTGQGEALGMVEYEGRWVVAPANVRIRGGGWTSERVPLDRFAPFGGALDETTVRFRNERFELTVERRPAPADRPPMGLTAAWPNADEPTLLARVTEHTKP